MKRPAASDAQMNQSANRADNFQFPVDPQIKREQVSARIGLK